jgi:hypothetical protein
MFYIENSFSPSFLREGQGAEGRARRIAADSMLARLGVPSLIERNGEDRAYSPENWQLGDLQAHHHSIL